MLGTVPTAVVMGTVGFAALVANVVSAAILYRYREGDSNMRSVWLCSRNDAISNVAVICAGLTVGYTATGHRRCHHGHSQTHRVLSNHDACKG
jgi:Co/Zn/Cd efflux system component